MTLDTRHGLMGPGQGIALGMLSQLKESWHKAVLAMTTQTGGIAILKLPFMRVLVTGLTLMRQA